MSLTHTTVRCHDNMWYRNPVWRGEDWFICVDDEDPFEFVCKKQKNLSMYENIALTEKILKNLNFECKIEKATYDGSCSRFFGSIQDRKNIKFAFSLFLKVLKAPPPPTEWTRVDNKKPKDLGTFYPFDI